MKITLVERQPVRVACLRYTGPLGEPVARFWRKEVGPWLADHGLLDCARYGLPLDHPDTTPADSCRYDACVAMPMGLAIPGASETMIPGGRFAVTVFKGRAAEIGAAWGSFVGAALSSHRFDPARPAHEHYPRGASLDSRTGVFSCELCLPLGAPAASAEKPR